MKSLINYIDQVLSDSLISEETAKLAKSIYMEFCQDLPIPPAGTGPNGEMFFCWDKDEHHFEIEVLQENVEYFYRNRKTGELSDSIDKINFFRNS